MFICALEQSCLFFPLALGVYLSYAILRTTDLTVDGSFVLGAAIFAKLVTLNFDPTISLVLALASGALAGAFVSFIQLKGHIPGLIASILTVFILNSLNLIIMGRPNISLLKASTLISNLSKAHASLFLVLSSAVLALLLVLLLKSKTGLILRASGENPLLLKLMGLRADMYKSFGLILSNTLAAYCGAITSQFHGYSDINMGFGMALIGIGTVAIAEQLRRHILSKNQLSSALFQILFCFAAVFLYFISLNFLVFHGFSPLHIKMAMGVFLILCLSITRQKETQHA